MIILAKVIACEVLIFSKIALKWAGGYRLVLLTLLLLIQAGIDRRGTDRLSLLPKLSL